MSSLVAEQLQENSLTKTYEIKNIIVTGYQDRIAELAETDEIKKLRKHYKRENEMMYEADRDILSFAHTLSGVAAQKIYVGQEAAVYFEILDTRDFLLKKYAELSTMEAAKYKDKIEPYLKEAEEELAFFESEIFRK